MIGQVAIGQLALIALGGAVGAVIQAMVVGRFGALWGGAGVAVIGGALFGAVWALSDPNPRAYWAITDRDTVAPLLFGLLAAAAPLSAILDDRSLDRPAAHPVRRLVRTALLAAMVLIAASATMMLGYLAIRGGYTLRFQLTMR